MNISNRRLADFNRFIIQTFNWPTFRSIDLLPIILALLSGLMALYGILRVNFLLLSFRLAGLANGWLRGRRVRKGEDLGRW